MMNCEEAARLISQSFDKKLTLRARGSLRLHLLMCRFCPKFLRQMRLLRTTTARYAGKAETGESYELSSEAAERIRRNLTRP